MYLLKTESSFDSAHFLSGYEGQCRNLHGHRWTVSAQICGEKLKEQGPLRGMVTDFSLFKDDLKKMTEVYDHALIVENGSLQEATMEAMRAENFHVIIVPFRPTAENFAKHFYKLLEEAGYLVCEVAVFETPNNCAIYRE